VKFIRLTLSLLADTLGVTGLKSRAREWGDRRELPSRLPVLVILAGALTLAWIFLLAFYTNIIKTGYFLRRPEIVFSIAALLAWIVLFLAALPAARSLFLVPRENELMRSLPFRPPAVALARFVALFVILLPLELFVFLPALIVFLRFTTPDARVIGGIAASVILVPLFPAALALALVLSLRRLEHFSRRAVFVEVAGMAVVALLLAAAQNALQHALFDLNRGNGLIFPVELAIFLGRLREVVPPAAWASSVFRPGEEIVSALLMLGFGAAAAALAVFFAVRVFPADAERPAGRMKSVRPAPALPRLVKHSSLAFVFRELKLLAGQPGLLFEAALRLLVLPLFLVVYAVAGPKELTALFIGFVSTSPWAALAAIGGLLFLIDISFLAATGLSREGRLFAVSLTLPVDGAFQTKARFAFLLLLSLPPAALSLALVYLLFPVRPETLVCAVPGVIAFFVFSIAVGMFLDLRRASFPRGGQPLAQNSAAVLALAIAVAALALLGAITAFALAVGLSPLAAGFLAVTLLAAADIVLLPRLFRYAGRRYAGGLEA
jgi:ABC-2 type transport system permease protein